MLNDYLSLVIAKQGKMSIEEKLLANKERVRLTNRQNYDQPRQIKKTVCKTSKQTNRKKVFKRTQQEFFDT